MLFVSFQSIVWSKKWSGYFDCGSGLAKVRNYKFKAFCQPNIFLKHGTHRTLKVLKKLANVSTHPWASGGGGNSRFFQG